MTCTSRMYGMCTSVNSFYTTFCARFIEILNRVCVYWWYTQNKIRPFRKRKKKLKRRNSQQATIERFDELHFVCYLPCVMDGERNGKTFANLFARNINVIYICVIGLQRIKAVYSCTNVVIAVNEHHWCLHYVYKNNTIVHDFVRVDSRREYQRRSTMLPAHLIRCDVPRVMPRHVFRCRYAEPAMRILTIFYFFNKNIETKNL